MILETRNDGVRFTYASLRSLSDEYQALREQYVSTQAAVAEELLSIAGLSLLLLPLNLLTPSPPSAGYAEPMYTLNDLLAQLDVFVR